MLNSLKALAVVLTIALMVFAVTKPIFLRYMSLQDWTRRRNVWVFLTVLAFVSPSFWVYALFAVVVMYWAGSKDTNPIALYIFLLFVVQPDHFELPKFFGASLIYLDNFRLLAIAVLVPHANRIFNQKNKLKTAGFGAYDFFVITFVVLQLVVVMPYVSLTSTLRSGLASLLDVVLVYYTISRSCNNKKIIVEVMSSLCLACAIFAPIAVFETLKSWLLYAQISATWNAAESFAYLFRGDALRARASTGHALGLGSLCAMGFGYWIYLGSRNYSKMQFGAGCAWMWAGLIAAYSRGPWIFAILIALVFMAISPGTVRNFSKFLIYSGISFGILLISPFSGKFVDSLPFVGTIDSENIDYRQRLITKSWEVIQDNPLLGDPLFMSQMEELRQGQGIIDLVNAYAVVALSTGFVGLTLCFSPILLAMHRSRKIVAKASNIDSDHACLGRILIACMIGQLFFIGTAGMDSRLYIWVSILIGYSVIKAPALGK